jgi:hypothetical protein
VRRCKSVVTPAADLLTLRDRKLTAEIKRNMWTKNWNMEKYNFNYPQILQELNGEQS